MENISQFCRRRCSVPCQFRLAKRNLAGEVVELSFDAAIIARSSLLPPVGTKLILRVAPGAEEVKVPAKVVYLQKQGRGLFGVKFSGSCEDNLNKLTPVFRRYVSAL